MAVESGHSITHKWWCTAIAHVSVPASEVRDVLAALSERLHAGFADTLAPGKAVELGNQAHLLAQARLILGLRVGIDAGAHQQHPPVVVFDVDASLGVEPLAGVGLRARHPPG